MTHKYIELYDNSYSPIRNENNKNQRIVNPSNKPIKIKLVRILKKETNKPKQLNRKF